jgi:hypothetical protein
MNRFFRVLPFVLFLFSPLVCKAQKLGVIDCPRKEGYAYLYSSRTPMESSTTLKCGQQVRVLDRTDNFLHVRTENGDDGFVPLSSVSYVKAGAVPKAPVPATKRELTHYDNPGRAAVASRPVAPPDQIVLSNQTPVHLKFLAAVSSATAHVGDEVTFAVAQDLVVGGFTVISKGAPATGTVTEVEPKRRMGHDAKLNVQVHSVQLANNEKAPLRSFGVETGANQSTGAMSLKHGKDVTLTADTEITAYIDGDLHLNASGFTTKPAPAETAAQPGSARPRR